MEEARSKLLLGQVPKGANIRVELAKRLRIWEDSEFGELLLRAEVQRAGREADRRRRRGGATDDVRARAKRSRAFARDGAYGKAVHVFTSDVAELSSGQQAQWAAELLPRSSRPATALYSAAREAGVPESGEREPANSTTGPDGGGREAAGAGGGGGQSVSYGVPLPST